MRSIAVFDEQNYEAHWPMFKRDSARAIIYVDKKLVMVKSEKFGEYKFPGGGIDDGETHVETLIRETLEEAGLHILPATIREYGSTLMRKKSIEGNKIFEQVSFYYTCDIDTERTSPQKLDEGYEMEYAYKLVYATLDEAIAANEKLLDMPEIPWVKRDLYVLSELRGEARPEGSGSGLCPL
ncbi:MAG: NUDIX domain-containing protein [Defluviitaleaceae bacterium]|nr:NUDIX domain-containing protein [Defluviitaleaceae bacterium]